MQWGWKQKMYEKKNPAIVVFDFSSLLAGADGQQDKPLESQFTYYIFSDVQGRD